MRELRRQHVYSRHSSTEIQGRPSDNYSAPRSGIHRSLLPPVATLRKEKVVSKSRIVVESANVAACDISHRKSTRRTRSRQACAHGETTYLPHIAIGTAPSNRMHQAAISKRHHPATLSRTTHNLESTKIARHTTILAFIQPVDNISRRNALFILPFFPM
jgi:hypothetical protein